MCLTVPGAVRLLGHHDEDLRVCLCLRRACAHHHRVLLPHGPEAEERSNAVRFAREGPQPAAHHTAGGGGGGRLCGLLDAHSHLYLGKSSCERARDHWDYGGLFLLRGAGLHQQQPQPCALRLSG